MCFHAVDQVSDLDHQKYTTLMQYPIFGAKHQKLSGQWKLLTIGSIFSVLS